MATQICPRCKEDAFTWHIDEEESPFTIWACHICNYQAFEDESKERKCAHCGRNTEARLNDGKENYWWCSSCGMSEGSIQ